MRIYVNAKRLLYISLTLISAEVPAWELNPSFPCGKYQFVGTLARNSQGMTILKMRKKTSSPIEAIVIGKALKREQAMGRMVRFNGSVKTKLNPKLAPVIYFEQFEDNQVNFQEGYTYLKESKCN